MELGNFLKAMFEDCEGYVELRLLPSKDHPGRPIQKYARCGQWQEMQDTVMMYRKRQQYHYYFGVATRDGKGGTMDNLIHFPAVWVDIDFKETPKAEADKKLRDFPLPPSFKVFTGGGYHVYWKFKEPLTVADFPDIQPILFGLVERLGGDPKATDAPRILRLPTTINYKYVDAPKCAVVDKTDLRYTLEDFDAFKADLATTTVGISRGPLDERKLGNGERNDELTRWAGKWASEGQDFDTVVKLTMGHNMIHCLNPLDQKDVEGIVKSVFKSEAKKLKELGIDPGQERKGKINIGSSGHSGQVKSASGQSAITSVVTSEATAEESSKPKSLHAMIEDFVNDSTGVFSNADIDRELSLTTRRERKTRAVSLARIKKDGKISPAGGRDGYWKRVETDAQAMDFMNITQDYFPIVLPFGLHKMVRTMPKSLIVYAGSPNSGKSALALNTLWHNICSYDIIYNIYKNSMVYDKVRKGEDVTFNPLAHGVQHVTPDSIISPEDAYEVFTNWPTKPNIRYFSSEMGDFEVHHRLAKWGKDNMAKWNAGMLAYECVENFADHAGFDPNGLNVIDFLEVYDNFYAVASQMKSIFDKLDRGVAIICLQKKAGSDFGLGGMHSAQKPRLYLALEETHKAFSTAKIVKAKNFISDNPNGKTLPYRIYNAGTIITSAWGDQGWAHRSDKDINELKKRGDSMTDADLRDAMLAIAASSD